MRNRAIDTHWLTHASFEPRARHGRWLQWPQSGWIALVLVLIMVGAGMLGDAFVSLGEAAALRAQQATLQAEVERLRTELDVEHATRNELERQAAGLNEQVSQLSRQVQFLAARSGNGPRPD